jgi:hypothetical protein
MEATATALKEDTGGANYRTSAVSCDRDAADTNEQADCSYCDSVVILKDEIVDDYDEDPVCAPGVEDKEIAGACDEEAAGLFYEDISGGNQEETAGAYDENTAGVCYEDTAGGNKDETADACDEDASGVLYQETAGGNDNGTADVCHEATASGTYDRSREQPGIMELIARLEDFVAKVLPGLVNFLISTLHVFTDYVSTLLCQIILESKNTQIEIRYCTKLIFETLPFKSKICTLYSTYGT